MTAEVRLEGGTATVTVRFSHHAVERFQERVRPSLSLGAAATELQRIARFGAVRLGRPEWCGGPHAFLYLVLGDVCFPVDPLVGDQDVLVATTCLCRGASRRARSNGRGPRSRPSRTLELPLVLSEAA